MGRSDPLGLSPHPSSSLEPCYLGNTRDDEGAALAGCLFRCPPTGLSQLANRCLCYWVQAVRKVALPCWGYTGCQSDFSLVSNPPKWILTVGRQCPPTPTHPHSLLTAAAVGGIAGAATLTQHSCHLLSHLHLGRGAGGGVWWVGEGQ
jgi:hypothetical protein